MKTFMIIFSQIQEKGIAIINANSEDEIPRIIHDHYNGMNILGGYNVIELDTKTRGFTLVIDELNSF